MPKPRTVWVGKPVNVLRKTAAGPWKWTAARIVAVQDSTHVTLATPQGVPLFAGASTAMRSVHGQTNVWKHQ
jgi:hypothetical protein